MIDLNKVYHEWCEKVDDESLKKELRCLWWNSRPIADRFFKIIDFGKAGLRGELGAGTNFMNIYTVRRATQGIADYMNKNNMKRVAISYDSRYMSKEFASETACVFAKNGITSYLVSDDKFSGVCLGDGAELKASCVFLAIGHVPNSELFIGNKTDNYIEVDEYGETSIDDVYACGDVINKSIYQLITASSEGVLVANSIIRRS